MDTQQIEKMFWDTYLNDKDFAEKVDKIHYEKEYVDIQPYSHNLIGLYLQIISKNYNQEFSNYIIKKWLLDLGWEVIEE